MELLGLRMKALREVKGLLQEDVAVKLGVGKSSISGYERNTATPSVESICKLSRFYGVSSDYLLGLSDNMACRMGNLTDQQIADIMKIILYIEQLNYINQINVEQQ